MIALESSGNDRVEAGDGRTEKSASGGTDNATGACACSARSEGSAASTGTDLCTDAAHAATRSILHDPEIDAQNLSAGFGAQHVCVGDIEVIACNGDIEIILQR